MTNPESSSTQLFSPTQEWWIAIVRIPICLLSILSDLTIIRVVHYNKYKGPYQRILLMMSTCDALFNVAWIMHPYAVQNKDGPFCDATAMITQIGLGTFFYAAMLSMYFVLTIRFGMKDEKIARMYEPWFHIISFGYGCASSVLLLFLTGFSADPETMTCYMHDYPKGCTTTEANDCQNVIIWIFVGIPQLILLALIVMNYIIIYGHVRTTINRGRSRAQFNDAEDSQTRRVRAVAVQAMLYVGASLVTTLPIPILTLFWESGFMHASSIDVVFAITFILFSLFVPFTGFLNLCVYIKPQYGKYRTDSPTKGRLWAIRRCCHLGGGDDDEPVAVARKPKQRKQVKNIRGNNNNTQLPEPTTARNGIDPCSADTCNVTKKTTSHPDSSGEISHATMSESTRTILTHGAEMSIAGTSAAMSMSSRTDLVHDANLCNDIECRDTDSQKASALSMSTRTEQTSPTTA